VTGQPTVADLVADPVLSGVSTVAGTAGLERVVQDVRWYAGDLAESAGHLVICGESHVTPPYLLDALVRRAQEAGAAALLVVAGAARPLLSGVRLA
jgi:purine catabolism regulator